MSVQSLLDSVLTITRKTRTADGQGGHPFTYLAVGTAAGKVSVMSGRDLLLAGKKEAVVSHAIYLEPGADVRIGDRMVVDGRTFEVRTPNQAGPTYPYAKVLAEEYQRGA